MISSHVTRPRSIDNIHVRHTCLPEVLHHPYIDDLHVTLHFSALHVQERVARGAAADVPVLRVRPGSAADDGHESDGRGPHRVRPAPHPRTSKRPASQPLATSRCCSLLLATSRYFPLLLPTSGYCSLLLANLLSFMIALYVFIRVREVVLAVKFDLDFEFM